MSQISDKDKGIRLHDETTWTKAFLENLEVTKTYFQLRSYWITFENEKRVNHPHALKFKVKANAKGEAITILRRRKLGVDKNNLPVYEINPHMTVKGFVKNLEETSDKASLVSSRKNLFLVPVDCDIDLDNNFHIFFKSELWRPLTLNVYKSHIEIEGEKVTHG
jgi:hypothetical protein